MEDGHQMLTHWTRKIIVEEGHTVPQLVHILHLIAQHFKVCRKYCRLMAIASEQIPCRAFALKFHLSSFSAIIRWSYIFQ